MTLERCHKELSLNLIFELELRFLKSNTISYSALSIMQLRKLHSQFGFEAAGGSSTTSQAFWNFLQDGDDQKLSFFVR